LSAGKAVVLEVPPIGHQLLALCSKRGRGEMVVFLPEVVRPRGVRLGQWEEISSPSVPTVYYSREIKS
jgi:hypothetical protein